MTDLLASAAAAALLSAIFVRLLATHGLAGWAMDKPNDRSLHETPVPRTGGLGLFAAASVVWAIFAGGALYGAVALAGLLLAPSLLDDVFHLSAGARLTAQAAAALCFLAMGGAPLVLWPLLLLTILWMTNLYNFMDGSDGLAGGMAVFGFAGYAVLAELSGARDIALVSGVVAGAALGFLLWNFHPAIVFLGDGGSVPLGFLAAAVGIAGWERGVWPPSLPPLLFAPFILDATLTLLRRLIAGEKITKAHRTHLYQRLIRSGLGHARVALMAYALMAALLIAAILSRALDPVTHGALAAAAALGLAGLFLYLGGTLPAPERTGG